MRWLSLIPISVGLCALPAFDAILVIDSMHFEANRIFRPGERHWQGSGPPLPVLDTLSRRQAREVATALRER